MISVAILNFSVASLGFWVLDVLLLLALAGVVVVLATDDRDPSTVLAWLFVVLLLPILIGGSIPNCLYAAWLLFKNKTHSAYREAGEYWLVILLMAVMYTGSVLMWGMSSSHSMLGTLGPSVGWALFIGGLVVSSNVGGFATGEWKGAGAQALRWMVTGITLMVLAAALIGYGNYRLN